LCARESRRVYIGGAPASMPDAVLVAVLNAVLTGTGMFSKPGPVISVMASTRADSNFRFIEMSHPDAASMAIMFSGLQIEGHTIRIQRSREYSEGSGRA